MVLQTVRLKSDKMATENSTLPVSEEHLNSSVVEDTQNNSVPADGGETNAAVADDTGVPTQSGVDFADEDAALAAENAGLDLGEASPEEEAAGGEAAGSDLAGKSKEELLAIFAKMLEERPVQSLRRDVEALKIAFYKLRRAESDAARRAFVEAGGAELCHHLGNHGLGIAGTGPNRIRRSCVSRIFSGSTAVCGTSSSPDSKRPRRRISR